MPRSCPEGKESPERFIFLLTFKKKMTIFIQKQSCIPRFQSQDGGVEHGRDSVLREVPREIRNDRREESHYEKRTFGHEGQMQEVRNRDVQDPCRQIGLPIPICHGRRSMNGFLAIRLSGSSEIGQVGV
jgi:hypothetical protein